MSSFTVSDEAYYARLVNGTENLDQLNEYIDLDCKKKLSLARINCSEEQPIVTTSASNIHGIDLFGDDRESDKFWQQHGVQRENYEELASHIPEVQRRLDNGESLEDLLSDEKIGHCARLYFDPMNVPSVSRYKDTYISGGGNRHRIIAAQNGGYYIPVRVTGTHMTHEECEKMRSESSSVQQAESLDALENFSETE